MPIRKNLGHTLKAFRVKRAWTQEDAEFHTGVPYRTIQDIEAGRSEATILTLFKVAKGMNLTPSELLEAAWKSWLLTGEQ